MDYDDVFGISPLIEGGGHSTIVLGDISSYIIAAIAIILIIYLIYYVFMNYRIDGENYHQRKARYGFGQLNGDTYDDKAKEMIEHGEAIQDKRAIDHYMLGTAYLINAKDPVKAQTHFINALNKTEAELDTVGDLPNILYILDRIGDFQNQFIDDPQEDIQGILLEQYNHANEYVSKPKVNTKIEKDDPEFVQKTLLSNIHYPSDGQNVHDSALSTELAQQYNIVKNENKLIEYNNLHDYAELRQYYLAKYKNDSYKLGKINTLLKTIDNNNPTPQIENTYEQDLITEIWRRAHDPRNAKNMIEIKNALGDAMLDCTEGGIIVCATGRADKLWQALAKIDVNPSIGVFKTKQMLRNEIYERAAKIVDDLVGKHGAVSPELKAAYNANHDTEQVKELIECIGDQIDELAGQYADVLPEDQLNIIIQDCKAAI